MLERLRTTSRALDTLGVGGVEVFFRRPKARRCEKHKALRGEGFSGIQIGKVP